MKLLPQKNEVREILRLAWPAVVEEVLFTVVTYVDTAMVGALGANASAAVGLSAQVNWLIMSFCGAMGVGVLSVCAQSDGAKDEATLQKSAQQALFLTLLCGIPLTVLCVMISPWLPLWLGAEEAIRPAAGRYFAILSAVLLFRASNSIFAATLRGVSDMKTPMRISLLMNVLNMVLNFFLIYPARTVRLFGAAIPMPGAGLGTDGAAIASAIAFAMGGTLMFLRYLNNRRFDFRHTGFRFDGQVMGRCMHIAMPLALQRGIGCSGHVVFASLIARLGTIPFAAHTIALQAEEAFYLPGYGFSAAASTLAGNAVGEKNGKKLNRMTYATCFMVVGFMFFAAAALFLLAEPLMGIFTPDAQVIELGAAVLRIVSVSEPVYGMMIILEGVFNGIGDTRAPVVYSILSMWMVRVLGSFIMVYALGLGLRSVWVMMVLGNLVRCGLLFWRYWTKHRTMEFRAAL